MVNFKLGEANVKNKLISMSRVWEKEKWNMLAVWSGSFKISVMYMIFGCTISMKVFPITRDGSATFNIALPSWTSVSLDKKMQVDCLAGKP